MCELAFLCAEAKLWMNEGQNCNVTSKLAESQRNEFYDNVLTFIEFGRASVGGFEQSKSNPVYV